MNPHCVPDPVTGRCATCADEGEEGRVVSLGADALARVEIAGEIREVAMDLVEGIAPGDRVLVHAGVALVRLGR